MINSNNFEAILFQEALQKHQKGKFREALEKYEKLLDINPNLAAIHNNIGLIHNELKEKKLAIKHYLKALNIDSKFVQAHNNLAIIYEELLEFDKAILHCKTAIKLDPNFSKAYNNLGSIYDEIGETKKAIEAFKRSIELDPRSIEAFNNLGSIFRYSGEYQEAINYYQKAIQINKNYPKARKNLGLVHLLLSNFEVGFEEFEWRIMESYHKKLLLFASKLNSLVWKGENLDEKVILVLSEQGIGDIIQFGRYIYELKEFYNVKIVFRTNKKLKHLFDNTKFTIITDEEEIPKHDYHIFLMSLPKFHFKREKILLKQYSYIKKNNVIFSKWKSKLSKIKSPKVGLNWQGGLNYKSDKIRSIPLVLFEPLFDIKKIEYVSIQKFLGEEQIESFKYKNRIHNFSSIADLGSNSFEDTIEIVRNLDLVITSCTAIAHLCSTIGTETWVLINRSPDWRWFLDQNKTPWYNNTKLFRQKIEGDWPQVIQEVKKEIIKQF